MNLLPLLFLPIALTSQETAMPSSKSTTESLPMQYRSAVMIDAKGRSDDIVKAYELLKREKPTLRISARTNSGQILSNIVDITPMPSGTLLLFRISSTQGIKNQFVSIDDVCDLFYGSNNS